jgi:hypothetical protein
VDGDGDLDLVLTFETLNAIGPLVWFRQGNDPLAHWEPQFVAYDFRSFALNSLDAADLDGDGDMDFVTGNHDRREGGKYARTIAWINYDGVGGAFYSAPIGLGLEHHDGTKLADLDGDGDLDIYSGGFSHATFFIEEHP